MPVTSQDRQRELCETYAPIEDRQERLAIIVDGARHRPKGSAGDRRDQDLVAGCQSRVWLTATCQSGLCHFYADGDSPLVNGLVALLCDAYQECAAADVVATEPAVLTELGLLRDLSPTRQNGLAAVRARIKSLAASFA